MRRIYFRHELDDLTQGARIAFIRQFRGLTQEEVAEKLEMKKENKRRGMARYESDERVLKEDRLLEIANILNVNVNCIRKYNFDKSKDIYQIYWKKLNMYNSDKSNFVYDSCLKYGNYKMYLEIIYEQPDKYDEKCLLLEKIKETKYNISQLDEYKIQKIFECFYDYEQIPNFERLAKLEIYYSPILENGTYFLSKEASKSPKVIAELAELIYRDEDGNFIKIDNRDKIVFNCYNKLHNLKIDFDSETALKWYEDFLKIMKEKKRKEVKLCSMY